MLEKGENGSQQNGFDLVETKVETILVSWIQLQRIKERRWESQREVWVYRDDKK